MTRIEDLWRCSSSISGRFMQINVTDWSVSNDGSTRHSPSTSHRSVRDVGASGVVRQDLGRSHLYPSWRVGEHDVEWICRTQYEHVPSWVFDFATDVIVYRLTEVLFRCQTALTHAWYTRHWSSSWHVLIILVKPYWKTSITMKNSLKFENFTCSWPCHDSAAGNTHLAYRPMCLLVNALTVTIIMCRCNFMCELFANSRFRSLQVCVFLTQRVCSWLCNLLRSTAYFISAIELTHSFRHI